MPQTFMNFLFINVQTTIISQCESKLVSVTLAQLLHKGNVYVGDAAALHTLEGPDARELGTVLVKVLLTIVVDTGLHFACEALLSFGVAVTEIVTVATGDEVEAVGLIGRPGAIVRGPVTARRILSVARFFEAADGDCKDEIISNSVGASCAVLKMVKSLGGSASR